MNQQLRDNCQRYVYKDINIENKNQLAKLFLNEVTNENYKVVQNIIQLGVDINCTDEHNSNALHYAAYNDKPNAIDYLIKNKINIKQLNSAGQNPLFSAVINNASAAFDKLSSIYDINTKDVNGYAVVHYAIANKNIDLVSKIFQIKEFNINIIDKEKSSLSHFAILNQDTKIAQFILDHKDLLESKNKDDMTPLLLTCKVGDLKLVQFLLSKNADVHAKDINGNTILTIAAKSGHKEIVQYLLDNRVKIDLDNTKEVKSVTQVLFGEACLNLSESVLNNNIDAVRFFLNSNINPNFKDSLPGILYKSVPNNNLDITEILLTHGAKINEVNKVGDSLLTIALKNKFIEMSMFLIQHNVAIDIDNDLLLACKVGNLKLVQFLERKNANLTAKDKNGETALSISAKLGYADIVKYLLDKRVPYEVNDNIYLTENITKCLFGEPYGTIFEAIESEDVEVVKFFVKYGDNLNTPDHDNFTPLIYAACIGDIGIINFIAQHVEDKTFNKPLHKIELQNHDPITFYIEDIDTDVAVNDLGLKIEYTADRNKHINWLQKSNELQSILKTNRFQLFDNLNGKYGVYFYNNSNEADLVLKLKINNQHVTLVKSFEHHHSKILLFEPLLGVETEVWHREKKLI
ncbi:MAG: hypothetical protein FK731_09590, partial [Asgard group archaeon]|nr:hypothetical protein [Asgard group archaeon]